MSRPLSRTLAAALVATLAATSLALAGAAPATAADGTVTGTVFRDFNANGVLDTATARGIAIDTGFGGVTVTAYDSDGGPSWTTTSAADGSYSIPVTNATGNAVRIEFTGLPTGYQPGAVASTGSANGTSVQFVNLGATGVDFAVNAPEDYSQGNAPLATAIISLVALGVMPGSIKLVGIGLALAASLMLAFEPDSASVDHPEAADGPIL